MPQGKRQGRQSARSSVDWLPLQAYRVAMNATAADAQVTLLDQTVENLANSQDYDSGTLVGVRAWIDHFPAVIGVAGAEVIAMILPSGMSVPTVNTAALKKANERFLWFMKRLAYDNDGSATTATQSAEIAIKSSRKFDQGDRLVFVIINRHSAATGAVGVASLLGEAYVREG